MTSTNSLHETVVISGRQDQTVSLFLEEESHTVGVSSFSGKHQWMIFIRDHLPSATVKVSERRLCRDGASEISRDPRTKRLLGENA